MSRILILYSTVDGHTLKICRRLQQLVERSGHAVTLVSLHERPEIDLKGFDKVVVGASIRYGKHRPQVAEFMRAHRGILERKPSAFFSVNIVARKPDKNTPETNPYVRKFLRQIGWRPRQVAVFAGMLDYPRYGFWDRQIIRFIMLLTRGPTDPRAVVEFTDWSMVDAFGRSVAAL
ncbi:MAG: menaquinone-dependent protoporphyrinogen IX dehydrogenase [Betaproteobacteria bacterium]|nr:menaquinone-dependent protoporphyrinogen IX dehydrogenase [Betaproteobacteria bacterium]